MLNIKSLKLLFDFASEQAGTDNAEFWRIVWEAASIFDRKQKALLQGFVAAWGIVPGGTDEM